MKSMKKIIALFLVVMLMVPTMVVSAATSSAKLTTVTTKNTKVTVTTKSATYNGYHKKPKFKVVVNGKTLKEGTDYIVTGQTKGSNAGTYTVKAKIHGIGQYHGTLAAPTVKYTIKRASQKISGASKKTVKYSKVKKKAQTVSVKSTAKGKVTYKSNSKKIKVSSKGKVTIKKGTKKGTYKITITAKATKTNYKKTTKTVKIVVK